MAVSIDAQAAINEIAAELAVRDKETEIEETAKLESKAFWGGLDWSGIDKFINDFKLQSQNSIASGVADEAAKAWKESDISGALEDIGDWLGEAYYDTAYPVIGVGDTALALGSGMLNMTGSAFATIPTILKSDDPLTKEESKDWRAKLYETSEKLDPITWDAKTPMGKSVTGAISGAFELFNEGVAFPVARLSGWVGRNVFDMGQKDSERLEASVAGVLTGASGMVGSLRVKSKTGPLKTEGYSPQAIANARANAIATVQSGNYLANNWKTIDPVGFAQAVKDGTALGKVAEAAKEMSIIINEAPVNLVKEGMGVHLGQMRTETTGGIPIPGLPPPRNPFVKRYEIDVNPEAMGKIRADPRELGTAGSLEVVGHEFSHVQDALNYDYLVPPRQRGDPATPTRTNPGTGNVNPVTGLPWSKDLIYGMGTEGMPAVTALSKILEEGVAKADIQTQLTNPTEVHSRLNNMQRTLSEKNMDFRDIIDWDLTTDAVWTKEVYKMPYDVMHMVKKIDEAVARGVVSKKAVLESLVAALEESRVYHPKQYSLGIIGR